MRLGENKPKCAIWDACSIFFALKKIAVHFQWHPNSSSSLKCVEEIQYSLPLATAQCLLVGFAFSIVALLLVWEKFFSLQNGSVTEDRGKVHELFRSGKDVFAADKEHRLYLTSGLRICLHMCCTVMTAFVCCRVFCRSGCIYAALVACFLASVL